jgi:hypothetical protein
MLVNPDNPPTVAQGAAAQEAAAAVGQPLQILHASTQRHLDDALAIAEDRRQRVAGRQHDQLDALSEEKRVGTDEKCGRPADAIPTGKRATTPAGF